MNLDDRRNRQEIIWLHVQPTELFHLNNVVDYCERRERQIEEDIRGISHGKMLSLDSETLFTELINSYLSDKSTDYPVLNRDKVELLSDSDQTKVFVLYNIPWTGNPGFFSYRPEGEYSPPSAEVVIHLDDSSGKITFYYEFPRDDPEGDFQERFHALLKNDVSWVVDSLDDIIRHFRDHEEKLKGIMGRALTQRSEAVIRIEGLMESVDIPEDVFRDKLSVSSAPMPSHERNPRSRVLKPLLFGQQEGRCKGTEFEIFYSEATVDHIVPKAAGGEDELSNLQVLCSPCNGLKDDGSSEAYMQKIQEDSSICSGYRQQE